MNEGDVCKFIISTLKIMVAFNSFVHVPLFVFMLNAFRELWKLWLLLSEMGKYGAEIEWGSDLT